MRLDFHAKTRRFPAPVRPRAVSPSTAMTFAPTHPAFVALCFCAVVPTLHAVDVFSPVLQPLVEDRVLAGAVMLVADKDRILHLEAVGYADLAARRPMRGDSLFWIASMTKPLTAAAFMMLVDEGRISVNAPASDYLSEFAHVQVRQPDGTLRPPASPILIRHLLTHTSGIRFNATNPAPIDALSLAESVKFDLRDPLITDPGTAYFYTNTGLDVAALIIERLSGQPFDRFLQDRLLTPLGMSDTTFFPTPGQLARLAKTYTTKDDKTALVETPIRYLTYPLNARSRQVAPGGGLFSTARDLARFCQMLLNGGVYEGKRYLSSESVRAMTTKQTGEAIISRYGFGMSASPDGTEFGHGGAYNTFMTVDHGEIRIFLVHQAGAFRHDLQPGKRFEAEVRRRYSR